MSELNWTPKYPALDDIIAHALKAMRVRDGFTSEVEN
jgi:hypothetical protein